MILIDPYSRRKAFAEQTASMTEAEKYVNVSEVDGVGYVHSPIRPMLLVILIGYVVAFIQAIR